jgi:hypothetical protein
LDVSRPSRFGESIQFWIMERSGTFSLEFKLQLGAFGVQASACFFATSESLTNLEQSE